PVRNNKVAIFDRHILLSGSYNWMTAAEHPMTRTRFSSVRRSSLPTSPLSRTSGRRRHAFTMHSKSAFRRWRRIHDAIHSLQWFGGSGVSRHVKIFYTIGTTAQPDREIGSFGR